MDYFVRSAMIEPSSMRDPLTLAEGFVAAGEKIIAEQRAVLEHLEQAGHDTGMAEDVPVLSTARQARYIANRNRIRAELACKGVAVESR